jgi:hypothetical protein
MRIRVYSFDIKKGVSLYIQVVGGFGAIVIVASKVGF